MIQIAFQRNSCAYTLRHFINTWLTNTKLTMFLIIIVILYTHCEQRLLELANNSSTNSWRPLMLFESTLYSNDGNFSAAHGYLYLKNHETWSNYGDHLGCMIQGSVTAFVPLYQRTVIFFTTISVLYAEFYI